MYIYICIRLNINIKAPGCPMIAGLYRWKYIALTFNLTPTYRALKHATIVSARCKHGMCPEVADIATHVAGDGQQKALNSSLVRGMIACPSTAAAPRPLRDVD